MTTRTAVIWAGLSGLLAAVLVGTGEFFLHFDTEARYGSGFDFFKGVTEEHSTLGHFIGVLGAPLYVLGTWHLFKMLQPASERGARVAFLAMAYGFVVGSVWIGSRATAGYIVNSAGSDAGQLALYELRYENLLTVIRIAALVFSLIFIWLCVSGRSYYPKWVAILNPIVLIIGSFLVYFLAPEIGKYMMPIALNIAFFILFLVSTIIAVAKYGKEQVS